MAYPRRFINDGEDVIIDLRPHWWFFAGPVAATIPAFVPLIGTVNLLDSGTTPRTVGLGVSGFALAAWASWLGLRWLRWLTTHFVVTSHRLIYRTGIIAKHGREIPLERVNNIIFNQSVFERLIGAGDLMIESAGERGQQPFHDIARPDWVQQEIYRQIEGVSGRRTSPRSGGAGTAGTEAAEAATAESSSAPPVPGIPEQIAQLADLHDRGAITQAEFDAKKAELLARL